MALNESHQSYYEISNLWDNNFADNDAEKQRIEVIISSIPKDVNTILEVGCGNGAIINNISYRRHDITRIVGVDISTSALQYVKTEKYIQNINDLQFPDKSFDCVIASEVIEHLTANDFIAGHNEIQRVASKYIIISVPNDDDLELDLRMCSRCFAWFNPNYHMNKFNNQSLKTLFKNFKAVWIKEIGPIVRRIKHKEFSKFYFHYKKKKPPTSGICPQCGFNYSEIITTVSDKNNKKYNYITKKFKTLIDIIVRTFFAEHIFKRRWLLGLYKFK